MLLCMHGRKHTLTLLGGPSGEVRVSAEALSEAIAALVEGAGRAARLRVEGDSTRPGPRPAWLDAVCQDIAVTGLQPGSTVIPIEASTLAEVAPEQFLHLAQGSLFGEPGAVLDPRQSAVDLFGNVLATALAGDRDALVADARQPGPGAARASRGHRCVRRSRSLLAPSCRGARTMGKNDLWIAAAARAGGATLLTTDHDFEHLIPGQLSGVIIPVQAPADAR